MLDIEKTVADDMEVSIPSGLKALIKGYADYASEVVLERAIPTIDGLKPSQRRILYTMYRNKNVNLTKSANVVGEVMKLHPHGDGAIYDTLVRLTDEGQYMNIPYISGKGNFGRVYFTEPAAASRYTECKLSPEAKLLFGEMRGVDMIPSYDNKFKEPSLLPVAFPSILVNPTQGIAVGMASNIPAFNMVEVNNAVISLIENGKVDDVLVPDYGVGGVYVKDEVELKKIMTKGRGRIKLRGKWHIEGKSIVIDQIPYYTNVDRIMSVMKQDVNVSDVRDESDFDGLRVVIECKSKAKIDDVLVVLLRDTSMQLSMTSNISVIIDNKPKTMGVIELLKEWVKFRKKVLKKTFKLDLESVQYEIKRYTFLLKLLNNQECFDAYIENVKRSENEGRMFLLKFDKSATQDIVDWVMGLSFKSIANIGNKQKHLDGLYVTERELKDKLANLSGVICSQLREINAAYGLPRSTEITTEDIVYKKEEKERPIPTKVYVEISDKFIKKHTIKLQNAIECMSDDNILLIDSYGRVLRINLESIDLYRGGTGLYIPVLLGIKDDFEIVDYNIEQSKKVVYFYRDGYVSTFDWGTWVGNKRKMKVQTKAVSTQIANALTYLPEKPYIVCITKNGKLGIAKTEFVEKSPTARTKLIGVDSDDEIVFCVGASINDLFLVISNYQYYMGKCKTIRKSDTFNKDYIREM